VLGHGRRLLQCVILGANGLTVFCGRRYHGFTYSRNEVWFRQIFLTISKVSPIMCEKSCQKFMTISCPLRSTLLSFCQINVTITSVALLIVTHIWPSVTIIWRAKYVCLGKQAGSIDLHELTTFRTDVACSQYCAIPPLRSRLRFHDSTYMRLPYRLPSITSCTL
jgi:hypothetical protein